MPSTPPRLASGTVSITSALSLAERKSAAITRNSTSRARPMLTRMSASAVSRLPASPGVADAAVRREQRPYRRIDVGLELLHRLLQRGARRRDDVDADRAAAIHAPEAGGADRRLDPHQLAERDDAARRRCDRHGRERIRAVPAACAQDHVEPPVAVEMLAHPDAVAERTHDRRDIRARPAGLADAAVVRHEPQLRFRELQVLEGAHLRARHLLGDDVLRRARAREQRVEVRRLQPDLDVAAVAEAAEQVALLRKHLQVREPDGDLFVDDLAELVDLRRIERPRADRRRRPARSGCSSS